MSYRAKRVFLTRLSMPTYLDQLIALPMNAIAQIAAQPGLRHRHTKRAGEGENKQRDADEDHTDGDRPGSAVLHDDHGTVFMVWKRNATADTATEGPVEMESGGQRQDGRTHNDHRCRHRGCAASVWSNR